MDLSISLGGLQRAASSVDQTAKRIASSSSLSSNVPASATAPTDIVDLSAEMVNLMQAKNAFNANINVLRAKDGMEKSLLSILA